MTKVIKDHTSIDELVINKYDDLILVNCNIKRCIIECNKLSLIGCHIDELSIRNAKIYDFMCKGDIVQFCDCRGTVDDDIEYNSIEVWGNKLILPTVSIITYYYDGHDIEFIKKCTNLKTLKLNLLNYIDDDLPWCDLVHCDNVHVEYT